MGVSSCPASPPGIHLYLKSWAYCFFFFFAAWETIYHGVLGYFSKGMIGTWLELNASGEGLRNGSSLFITCFQKVEVTLGLGILILPRRRKDPASLKL